MRWGYIKDELKVRGGGLGYCEVGNWRMQGVRVQMDVWDVSDVCEGYVKGV